MGSAVKRLTDMGTSIDRYDVPHSELLPMQLEAADELFRAKVDRIKLLENRAETGGIGSIRQATDIVPLLFAHTAYKSYPEGWLNEGKWDRMTRWLETSPRTPLMALILRT
jgi:hypothetical protein